MQEYEVMYIIRPDLDDESVEAVITKLKDLVAAEGEVTECETIGKRRLAYDVKKHAEGIYVVMRFKSKSETSQELERVMKISDDVIRYLVVRDEE